MTTKQRQLIALRTGEKPAERSGEYWSKEDSALLGQLYSEGVGISEIALRLGRSEMAVCQQLIKMNLFSAQGKPRNRKKKGLMPECYCSICQVTNCANYGKEYPYAGTIR